MQDFWSDPDFTNFQISSTDSGMTEEVSIINDGQRTRRSRRDPDTDTRLLFETGRKNKLGYPRTPIGSPTRLMSLGSMLPLHPVGKLARTTKQEGSHAARRIASS